MSDAELLYLAYGSNLHPRRLAERVPSSRLVGTVALPGWGLRFDKRSPRCGSGKCRLGEAPEEAAYGAVYALDPGQRWRLDAAEGLGREYFLETLEVTLDGRRVEVFTYRGNPERFDAEARPFTWYRDLVAAGARHLGFPARYVARIAAQPARPDPVPWRQARQRRLVSALAAATG